MTEPTLTPSQTLEAHDRRPAAARRARVLARRAGHRRSDSGGAAHRPAEEFRPKSVLALDDDRKAQHLAEHASLPDALAARALVVYHLAEQREMMGAFLDALGIAHENGLIKDDEVKPDPAKMAPAVAATREKFPAEDVSLYLDTLLCQDPETWGGLKELTPQTEEAGAEAGACGHSRRIHHLFIGFLIATVGVVSTATAQSVKHIQPSTPGGIATAVWVGDTLYVSGQLPSPQTAAGCRRQQTRGLGQHPGAG